MYGSIELIERMRRWGHKYAVHIESEYYTYDDILKEAEYHKQTFGLRKGAVVLLSGGYSLRTLGQLVWLMSINAIIIPTTVSPLSPAYQDVIETTLPEFIISPFSVNSTGRRTDHPLYEQLREAHVPGLVLLSSGTSERKGGPPTKHGLLLNHHPTVKPLALMEYLCTLTKTPTGGVVLDPFMGSGTTGIACVNTGRDFIGIDISEEYVEIARRRITYAEEQQAEQEEQAVQLRMDDEGI